MPCEHKDSDSGDASTRNAQDTEQNPEARRNIHSRSCPSGFRGERDPATASFVSLQTCETHKFPVLSHHVCQTLLTAALEKRDFSFSRKQSIIWLEHKAGVRVEIVTQLSRVKQQCWVLFAGNLIKNATCQSRDNSGATVRENLQLMD